MTTIFALILSIPILYVLPNAPFIGPILRSLGVNETLPLMAGFFAISYFFVSQFIIKPYLANLAYRRQNTGGSLEAANTLTAQTEQLVTDYQDKMKRQNEAAQEIYEKLRNEGRTEEERLLTTARKNASDVIARTKEKISEEVADSKETLKSQIPQLSEMIASRVLGRDLS